MPTTYIDDATMTPITTELTKREGLHTSPYLFYDGEDGSLWRYMMATRSITYLRKVR